MTDGRMDVRVVGASVTGEPESQSLLQEENTEAADPHPLMNRATGDAGPLVLASAIGRYCEEEHMMSVPGKRTECSVRGSGKDGNDGRKRVTCEEAAAAAARVAL